MHFPCDQSERGRDDKKNQQARKNRKLEKFKNVESGIGFCSPARRLVCHKPLDIRWQMKSNDYGKQKNAAMAAIPYLGSLFYARNNSILSLSLPFLCSLLCPCPSFPSSFPFRLLPFPPPPSSLSNFPRPICINGSGKEGFSPFFRFLPLFRPRSLGQGDKGVACGCGGM